MAGRTNSKLDSKPRRKKGVKSTLGNSSLSNDQTFLAAKIHAWATEEMKCCFLGRDAGKEMPPIEKIKHLCRGSQMVDIWDFVTSNLVSRDKASKIRGNLILQRGRMAPKSPKKPVRLQKEQQRLLQMLSSLNSSLVHTEKTVEMLEMKVQESEVVVQTKKNMIRNSKRKICVLEQMNNQINKKLRLYFHQIESFKLLIAKTERLKQMEIKLEDNEKHSAKVERQCQEEVQNICQSLEAHITQLTGDDLASKDAQTYLGNQEKQKLWISAWTLMCSYPIKFIANALLNMSAASIAGLTAEVEKINIEEDANALQFGYETKTGELIDKSKPREILQSVGDILQEELLGQVSMGIHNEEIRNRVADLQKQLKEEVKTLEKLFRNCFNNSKPLLQVTKSWLQDALELVSVQAALMFLNNKQTEINEELERTRLAIQEKELKLIEIQGFRKIKEEKHTLIRTHIGQNIGIHEWLNNLRQGITTFVQDNLCNKYGMLSNDIKPLWDCVSNQLDVLETLPFNNLSILLEHNWNRPPSLSIYSLDILSNSSSTQNNAVQSLFVEILSELKFPLFKSSEALLEFILKCKLESISLDCVRQNRLDEIMCKNGKIFTIRELNDLIAKVKHSDETLCATLLQEVKKTIELTTTTLQLHNQVDQDLETWWNQPAKNIPSKSNVLGLSLQQWLDRWATAIATRLSKSDCNNK